tara:strand:+ start:902 stop:1090 length:189 start_codon:yes stop_codon:yes gene_type:complete
MAIKKYNLKIIYDTKTGDIEHLSEDFSDLDILNFEIDGKSVAVPKELQEMIQEICEDELGIS